MSRRAGAPSALAVAVALMGGCGDLVLPADPDTGPEAVARALWTEVDAYYSWFELKGVDWDAVGAEALPGVEPGTSNGELFSTLSSMLEHLRDGHVVLETPFDRYQWTGWHDAYPDNYRQGVAAGYLVSAQGSSVGGRVLWGLLDEGIGYIHLATFGQEGIGEAVDRALAALGPLSGLVVDVRHNGGGSDTHSTAAAARFVRQRRHYRTHRYKAGPGHDDFAPEVRSYVEPAGDESFHGPIVVLQNRRTFSAAEGFILAMRVRPDVTFVGDHTGGGAGNPIPRELPNGWVVKVSRWQAWAADGTVYEGTGLAPDVSVGAPEPELLNGRDAILEGAVALLRGS